MIAFLPLLAVRQDVSPTSIDTALVIGGVGTGGRRPTPQDPIADQIAAGTWQAPHEGSEVAARGRTVKWRTLHVNKDGFFDDDALDNGYLSVQVDSPQEKDAVLNCKGDSLVYVNGAPRMGDPYSYGYLNLPIHLKQGANELLFVCGRGRVSISLKPVAKPIWLQPEDATLPDILTSDHGNLLGSVVVCNSTPAFTKDLKIRVTNPKDRASTAVIAAVPPGSDRKEVIQIPTAGNLALGKNTLKVELLQGGKVIDSTHLDVQVKKPLDLQKRTFLSGIDGSVQYYAVWPASTPSTSNALVLTLHGASVEAIGQAAAYAQKSWATIVAPTNRRPYGFDWEGIGRMDALEVLDLAKKAYPHDPQRVDLTGHSMGGHGTWSIGTLYPNLFASISPSAGWISFWSYAGGWNPPADASPALQLLRRSMNVGDTLGRVDNTLEENVYILHGAVDDNVPVEQARTMKAKLESIHHPNLQYHEQPGANHWWGNQCVDWPPIFQTIQDSKLNFDRNHIDFTTQDPAVSANFDWITVEQQEQQLAPSHVLADRSANGDVTLSLTNVARIKLSDLKDGASVTIDGQPLDFKAEGGTLDLVRSGRGWARGGDLGNEKGPQRGGPFKQVFNHRFAFVVGTKGSEDENRWALNSAIYRAESMLYQGNGAVDIVLDKDFSPGRYRGRDLILFGNASTNGAWASVLGSAPVQFGEGTVKSKLHNFEGIDLAGLLLYPRLGEKETLAGAITGTGVHGFAQTDRLALFSGGVDYPDWIVISPSAPQKVLADGFFSNSWQFDLGQSASAGR